MLLPYLDCRFVKDVIIVITEWSGNLIVILFLSAQTHGFYGLSAKGSHTR